MTDYPDNMILPGMKKKKHIRSQGTTFHNQRVLQKSPANKNRVSIDSYKAET